MLASVAILHASGAISTEGIILAATGGTLLGSTINFYIGYYGARIPFVQKLLQKPAAIKVQNFTTKKHLFITMTVGRFITLARPLYSLVLGALQTKPQKFFMYEIPIVLSWVLIWLFVLLQGEKLFFYLFGS
jgi:membrane protein DedA with SNARE-associated domain